MIATKTYYASLKGVRAHNEDTHIIDNNGTNYLWGVYDGHGGKDVSKYLGTHLGKNLLSTKSAKGYTSPYIRSLYDKVQSQLIKDAVVNTTDTGSTAIVVVMTGNRLQVVNVGDCRVVICQNGLAVALSTDHKPDWINERMRIEKVGGKVWLDKEDDVYRVEDLSVSRSFGDTDYSKYVTHKPEISSHRVKSSDQFMIIACDGLWDVMDSQEAVNYILSNSDKSNVAKSLANHAIRDKRTVDNVTVIVVYFNDSNKSKSTTLSVKTKGRPKDKRKKKNTNKKIKKGNKSMKK